jgi:hypothetical protein
VSKFGSEWQGVFGRGRDLQAARPYWFELIPADKMSYENNDEAIEELHQHQPAVYPSNANFSTHEIQPRLRLGQPSKDLLHLVKVPQITTLPLDLDVLNASLGRSVLDTLDGLVSLVLLSVDHDHSAVSEGEGEGDLLTDSFGSSGDDGGLRTGIRAKTMSVVLKESKDQGGNSAHLARQVTELRLGGSDDGVEYGLHC